MPIEYFILNLHGINYGPRVYTYQFSAFEWIRKIKKHKNKSIGFLFKFAKINRRKNIQIYGTENLDALKELKSTFVDSRALWETDSPPAMALANLPRS